MLVRPVPVAMVPAFSIQRSSRSLPVDAVERAEVKLKQFDRCVGGGFLLDLVCGGLGLVEGRHSEEYLRWLGSSGRVFPPDPSLRR